jgi:hypothetical protein
MSATVNRHQISIFDVSCHNTTDTKDHLLEVRQEIFGVGKLNLVDTKDESLVSANLRYPTPFQRYRL